MAMHAAAVKAAVCAATMLLCMLPYVMEQVLLLCMLIFYMLLHACFVGSF